MSRKRHEVQSSKSNIELALSKERTGRVGLDIMRKKGVAQHVLDEIRKDVAESMLSALRYYLLAGAYQNAKQLLERFRNVSWLSEEENAELSINKLKIQLVEGDLDEVEPRAQDWLRLCKERGWRRLQTLVARLLSTLGKMVEG